MKIRKGSLSYLMLLGLEKATEDVWLESFTYSGQMKSILGLPVGARGNSLAETFRRLRKKGLIEQEKNDEGKILLKITQLGKDFIGAEEEWDGKYRIVIWDIPEKKRRIRDLFRRRLKEWGFAHWQGSVWISKKNVTDKLRKLVLELKMESWVAIIESDDPSLSHINFNGRGG